MTYNTSTLMAELLNAGLPAEGVDSNGKIDFAVGATDAQRDQAAQILAAHNPEAPAPEDAAQSVAMNAFNALIGRDIKTLSVTDIITVLRILLAREGLIGSDDIIKA